MERGERKQEEEKSASSCTHGFSGPKSQVGRAIGLGSLDQGTGTTTMTGLGSDQVEGSPGWDPQ